MEFKIDDIKILEYNPSFAKAVADMWNRSSEGWNGSIMNRTEETVLREHENASHLNVFLAVKGEEVIGYCSLDEYFLDEGALYINTLNVRPDYHGKKIGKLLVLTAVNRAIELGWLRLDLFTWPGNTKAVPLYKKCGFFWEKRDNTTHLMNYIPTVLKTEAISDFFETADWYEDSTRVIEIKPDGRRENKFDYFEYSWEKNGKTLRVEFERTGRGMRLIETDDYLISMTVQDHELVFGRSYKVRYNVVNKSGKPLNVTIKGCNDKNIVFNLECSVNVENHEVIEDSFFVGEVKTEQNPNQTYPAVASEILINGKKAFFKVGIFPVYPAKFNLHIPGNECYIGVKSECYLEIENKFSENAVFELNLPERDGIKFEQSKYKIELEANGRNTLEIPYILDDFIYYSAVISAIATLKSGETIPFEKEINAAFRGRSSIMWGENENYCEIINGPFNAVLSKQSNMLSIHRLYGDSFSIYWSYPRLGKPFSIEFSKKKPDDIQCSREDDKVVLKAIYSSQDFKGLQLASICKLSAGGIAEHYYELKNIGNTQTSDDIWLSDTFMLFLYKGVIPYDGRFIELDDTLHGSTSYWNSDKITENWLFAYGDKMTRGICWYKEEKVKFDNRNMFFEHNFGRLPAGACIRTKPVIVALGAFNDWQDFREFALKRVLNEKPSTTEHLYLTADNGNPFVNDNFKVSLKDFKNGYLSGEFILSSENKIFQEQSMKLDEDDNLNEVIFDINSGSYFDNNITSRSNDIINLTVDTSSFTLNKKIAVFFKKPCEIKTNRYMADSLNVLSADNGIITIKTSPDFSYSLFSLIYKEQEWLDTSFPSPGLKSWWNPWVGGINLIISGISTASMLEESRQADFVELKDVLGNTWKGIRNVVNIQKNELYKGLKVGIYFLMLPGIPVVCCMTGVVQKTGRYLNRVSFINECFLKTSDKIKESWITFEDGKKEMFKLKAGKEERYISAGSTAMYGSDARNERLLIFADNKKLDFDVGVNNTLIMAEVAYKAQVKNDDRIFTPPFFLIFSDNYLSYDVLKDLKNIEFKPEELDI